MISRIPSLIFACFFALFFSHQAMSQENYIPAAIFTLDGDTLKGLIDYRNWSKNPLSITFKEVESSIPATHTPKTIRGFSVNNDLYISAEVEAEASPYELSQLTYIPDIVIRKDIAFLQVMILGSKSLYSYLDMKGKQQYYIKQYPDFELLKYKKYLAQNPNKADPNATAATIGVRENNYYKGQLMLYFQDCPEIQSKINTTAYTQKNLLKLFEAYHKCSTTGTTNSASPAYMYSGEKVKFQFGANAAPLLGTVKFTSTDTPSLNYIANVDYPARPGIAGGLFMDVVLPRSQGRYSVYTDLIISTFTTGKQYDVQINGETVPVDVKIGYTQLKLSGMFRYKFVVKEKFSLFANTGIQYAYTMKEKYSLTVGDKNHDKPFELAKKTDLNYLFGLGAGIKKFTLETRYEFGGELSAYTNISLNTRLLYFMIGYQF